MKIIRRIFCKHKNLIFVRNIYGDEINQISLKHTYRSIWVCEDCGKIIYKGELYEERNYKEKGGNMIERYLEQHYEPERKKQIINISEENNVGDIKKIYEVTELLNDFCAETACPDCPIRKACNKISKDLPIGQGILEQIKFAYKNGE